MAGGEEILRVVRQAIPGFVSGPLDYQAAGSRIG